MLQEPLLRDQNESWIPDVKRGTFVCFHTEGVRELNLKLYLGLSVVGNVWFTGFLTQIHTTFKIVEIRARDVYIVTAALLPQHNTEPL